MTKVMAILQLPFVKFHALANAMKSPNCWKGLGNTLNTSTPFMVPCPFAAHTWVLQFCGKVHNKFPVAKKGYLVKKVPKKMPFSGHPQSPY